LVAEPIFRVISLIIGMLVIGFGWYKINNGQENKRAKKEAIKYSVIFAVLYMVVILGLTG